VARQIDILFDQVSSSLAQVRAGKIKALLSLPGQGSRQRRKLALRKPAAFLRTPDARCGPDLMISPPRARRPGSKR
jgi:hypothetical protein